MIVILNGMQMSKCNTEVGAVTTIEVNGLKCVCWWNPMHSRCKPQCVQLVFLPGKWVENYSVTLCWTVARMQTDKNLESYDSLTAIISFPVKKSAEARWSNGGGDSPSWNENRRSCHTERKKEIWDKWLNLLNILRRIKCKTLSTRSMEFCGEQNKKGGKTYSKIGKRLHFIQQWKKKQQPTKPN